MRVSAPSEGTHPADAIGPAAASRLDVLVRAARERASVSVVIPTKGRPELLGNCLAALFKCEWHEGDLEIVVVDDGPSTQSCAAVQMWTDAFLGRGIGLRYETSDGAHGPAAARNHGWRAARGHIIAFTDDDTQPHTAWLLQGVCAFSRGADAAWGRIVMPIPERPTDYELDANGLERAPFVTANCFCRRAVLEQLGGFDERFQLAWREDTDFYFRLLRSGARVDHVPTAVVLHPVRPAPWGISIRQQRKVVFDALLYKKHPRLYRSRIRAAPRWDYYLVVLALAVATWGWVAELPWLVALGGSAWITLTAAFCAKRLAATSKSPSHVAEMLITSSLIPPLAVFWRLYGAIKFRTFFV